MHYEQYIGKEAHIIAGVCWGCIEKRKETAREDLILEMEKQYQF